VQVKGQAFGADEVVTLSFIDTDRGATQLLRVKTDPRGAFTTGVTIPANATLGDQEVRAKDKGSGQIAKKTFTVT
jgi:hypothetical protein